MSSDHSTISEKSRHLLDHSSTRGVNKVKYQGDGDWDFHVDAGEHPIDMSLMLPHYRARHQPVEHRMSMFVANQSESLKLKVCRSVPQSKFYLEVISVDGDITIWLPSDFKGQIHHSGKTSFSAGFVNRILRNVRINEPEIQEFYNEDDVVVVTRGHIMFRMWDVQKCGPENTHKESFKRLFGCSRKTPETTIDWDCLLHD